MNTELQQKSEYYKLHPRWYRRGHKLWILGHVFQHKGKLFLIVLFSLLGILLQVLIPFILGAVFEKALPENDMDLIINSGILVMGLGLFKLITNFISSASNEIIAQNCEMQIRVEFYENLENKSMSYHDTTRIGNLMSMATGDTRRINASISPGVRMIISTLFSLIIIWFAMFIASPTLSTIFLFAMPFYLLTLLIYAKRLHPLSVKRQAVVAKMNAELQENLSGVRVVRTFSGQDHEISKFGKTIDELEWILRTRGIASAYYIPSLILNITTAAIFLVAAYLIEMTLFNPLFITLFGIDLTIQNIGIGELITFLGLIGSLSVPTMFLRWILDMTLLGFAGADRIFTVLTTPAQMEEGTFHLDKEKAKGSIEFKNVSFAYKEGNPLVLNNINLKIDSGDTVAIIGPTGCGKTTLAKLVYRLYDSTEGEVEIDGVNIKEWQLTSLRKLVGVIEQDTFLFSTSIRKNIKFGKHGATMGEIIEAAKAAQAHEFIQEFKEGYETIIGERGITLSGGQRQRVAMARGFLSDPRILIMDDSTSAVDAETESKIQEAIKQLLKNRTTLIITHRLSTLKSAKKIIFMEKGIIARIGTHDELIRTFGPYRNIFRRYQELPPFEGEKIPQKMIKSAAGGSS